MLCKENQWLAKTRKLQFVTPIWQRPSKCLTSKNMMFTTCSTFLCALDLQETNINILLRLVTWPAAAFNQIVWWSSVLTTLCELSSIGTRLTRFFNFKAFLWQKFEIIMVLKKKKTFFSISVKIGRARILPDSKLLPTGYVVKMMLMPKTITILFSGLTSIHAGNCIELMADMDLIVANLSAPVLKGMLVWLPTGTKMPLLVEICEVSSQLQIL